MLDDSILVLRIIGTLSFLLLAAVSWRIAYYLRNKTLNSILIKVAIFFGVTTLISIICVILDVYILPEWKNIFSAGFRNTFLLWPVVYFYMIGTKVKNRQLSESQGKLSRRLELLITDLENKIK